MASPALRRNIIIPLALLMAALAGLIVYGVHLANVSAGRQRIDHERQAAERLLDSLFDKEERTLAGLANLYAADQRIVEAFASSNADILYHTTLPVYKLTSENFRVTHLFFIDLDKKVVLRVHNPERKGDKVERTALTEAISSGQTSGGLDLNPAGLLTLRYVAPMRLDGRVIGYLELGEEFGSLNEAIKSTLGTESALLLDKKYLERDRWEGGGRFSSTRKFPWDRLPDHVSLGSPNLELLDLAAPVLGEILGGSGAMATIQKEERSYLLWALPISAGGRSTIGSLLMFTDVTGQESALSRNLLVSLVAAIAFFASVVLFFYHRLGREAMKVKEEHFTGLVEQARERLAAQQNYIAGISQAKETIDRQSRFVQGILDAIPIPVFYKDSQGGYLGCNLAFENFFGFTKGEIAGKTVRDVFPNGHEAHESADAALLAAPGSATYESVLPDSAGDPRNVLISKATYVNPGDGRVGIVAAVFDITEQKQARRSLKASEERLRSIFDNARVGITMLQSDGSITDANTTFREMTGHGAEELKGLNLLDMALIRDRAVLAEALRSEDDGGPRRVVETRLKTITDGEINVSVTISPVAGRTADSSYSVAIVQGIDDRIEAQKERDLLAEAVEFADETIIVTDASSRILYANPAFERTTGYAFEEVIGKTPAIFKSGVHDDHFYRTLWDTLNRGEPWRGRLVNKKRNGDRFEEAATISPVLDDEGMVVYFVAVKRDVTRENELEASLRQAHKMEAVGTLASGIAHDFNNILHAITGFTQVLLSGEVDQKNREYLELVLDTAGRGADLVTRILTFSRASAPERKPLDLNREVAEILKMVSKAVPKNVGFDLRLSGDLIPISAMADQIHQIVMNLCANAWDAMPQGGVITIVTRNVEWSRERFSEMPEAPRGTYVELMIEDTGIGMDKPTLDRIFDPFFTTKPVGKGTGLGLATVYGIVKSHDGYIRCRSRQGQGTAFSILFPGLEDRRRVQVAAQGRAPELKGGDELLLIVDDEENILATTRELLESFGYTVLTAGSGEEALTLYCGGEADISLILLDLGMPGMGGARCLEELLKYDPACKVIIASGYEAREETAAVGASGYMRKPFRLADLLRLIRKVLEGE